MANTKLSLRKPTGSATPTTKGTEDGHPIAAVFDASAGFATIAPRRDWHNQRRQAARRLEWRPAEPVDLNRSQARSYVAPLSRSASLTARSRQGQKNPSIAKAGPARNNDYPRRWVSHPSRSLDQAPA